MSTYVNAVSIVSLLCSLLQLIYIVSILWLLRRRSHRLRASADKLPAAAVSTSSNGAAVDGSKNGGHTMTQTGYYDKFLPHSFHSVVEKENNILQNSNS